MEKIVRYCLLNTSFEAMGPAWTLRAASLEQTAAGQARAVGAVGETPRRKTWQAELLRVKVSEDDFSAR